VAHSLLQHRKSFEWLAFPADFAAIAAELGAAGRYDQAAFARMIRNKRFGLFITEGDRGGAMFKQRYNPPVAEAMASAYPNTSMLGRFTIYAPRR